MNTLLDLANSMDRLAVRIPIAASRLASEVSELLQVDLTATTPVDTSKAISNWVMIAGEPWDIELDAYYEGSGGSTMNQSIEAALIQGRQQIALKQPGEPLFIANNASYIRDLNDGTSAQAPAGFVEACVMRARRLVKTIRLNLNGR